MKNAKVIVDMKRENERVLALEENRKLKQEIRTLEGVVRKQDATMRALRDMVDRLQEAIVNQAMLLGAAMEMGEEMAEDETGKD